MAYGLPMIHPPLVHAHSMAMPVPVPVPVGVSVGMGVNPGYAMGGMGMGMGMGMGYPMSAPSYVHGGPIQHVSPIFTFYLWPHPPAISWTPGLGVDRVLT